MATPGRSAHGAGPAAGWAWATSASTRSSQTASAWRAMRHAASAVSAAIRAASASSERCSSVAPIFVAAARSRVAVVAAARAALLTSLISSSQTRAAVSASSVVAEVAYAARNRAWAASFSRRTAAGIGDRRGGVGPRQVLVVGALGGAQRLVGGARAGPRPDGELAALGGDAPLVGAAVDGTRAALGRADDGSGRRVAARGGRGRARRRGLVDGHDRSMHRLVRRVEQGDRRDRP